MTGNKNIQAAAPSGKSVNDVPAKNQLKKTALENAFRQANRDASTPVQPQTQAEAQGANYQQTAQGQAAQQNGSVQKVQAQTATASTPQATQQSATQAMPQTSTQAQNQPTARTTAQQTSYIYDNDTDYSVLINQYVQAGNYGQAAVLEQQRNAKIDAEGLPYDKTNTYAAWLPGGENYVPGNYIQMTSTTQQNLSDLSPYINQMYDAVDQQIKDNINYETQSAADQLQRALQDAQPQYERAIAQQLIETKQAQDAQSLRNQVNGDRGGIGSAQVDSIGNTGAKNREAIAQQQRQLATDTARQLADLRAQGKYQEANQLLQSAQQRLSALYNEQVRLQQEESSKKEILANLGQKYMAAGIMPSADMLAALGIDEVTAQKYVELVNASKSATGGNGGDSEDGEDGGDGGDKKSDPVTSYDGLSDGGKAVMSRFRSLNTMDSPDANSEIIMNALDRNQITAQDAEFIGKAVGISSTADDWLFALSILREQREQENAN